jgi:integrase
MALFKRGSMWWYNFHFAGQRYCRSCRTTSKHAAANILAKLKVRLAEEEGGIRQAKKTRFEDLAALYTADLKANGRKSVVDLGSRLRHLELTFSGKLARAITPSDVKRHVAARLAEGAANGTINRELASLKRMFNLGLEAEIVDSAPRIKLLKEAPARKGFFDAERFSAVLAALPEHLRPVAEFSYYTGWRRSEVTGLKWDQVDLRERTIRLWQGETKSGEGRFLPLEGETLRIVHEQRQILGSEHVFNHHGRRIETFYKAWKAACEAAGCPGALFHDFRRTAARNLRRKGLSESESMLITGHRTSSIFRRYSITTENDLRQAVAGKGVFQADLRQGFGRQAETPASDYKSDNIGKKVGS